MKSTTSMAMLKTICFGTIMLAAAMPLVLCAMSGEAVLNIVWNANGPGDIRHNGKPFLKPKEHHFRLHTIEFEGGDSSRSGEDKKTTRTRFNLQSKTETHEYEWGAITCRYHQNGNALHILVKIENRSTEAITGFRAGLFEALLPLSFRNLKSPHDWTTGGLDTGPNIVGLVDSHGGHVGISNWEYGQPVDFGLDFRRGSESREFILSSTRKTDPPIHPVFDLTYFERPSFSIAPGETKSMHVSLQFGAPGENSQVQLCAPVLDAYREINPFRLHWPDRRPIGAVFLTQPHRGWKTNPRGYITGAGEKEDITTPEGLKKFGESLMAYADRTVAILKDIEAQGVIIWDIEGQEFPHFISYIGQPDLLPKLAPEMDRYADAFFKKFTDAGIKVGVCIRPTEAFVFEPGEKEAYPYKSGGFNVWHRNVKHPGRLLNEKIAYAKKRWGCTLFYFDTNSLTGFVDPKDGSKPRVRGIPGGLTLEMYEEALQGHEDVLLMPEWFNTSFYAFSAPYHSPNLGQINMNPVTRYVYPKGFSFINTGYNLLQSRWDDYEQEVANGSVLGFNAWYASGESRLVKAIYQTVAYKKKGCPAELKSAGTEKLVEALKSADPYIRYWGARRLGGTGRERIAMDARIEAVNDPELSVCKAAIESLGAVPDVLHREDPRGIETLLRMVLNPKGDEAHLAFAAAAALADHADLAAPEMLERLQAARATGNKHAVAKIAPHAARVFAGVKTPGKAMVMELIDIARDTSTFTGIRGQAVDALGKLQAKAAVPALIEILDSIPGRNMEDFSCTIVEALGRIGDPAAIPALEKNSKRHYSSVAVYRIPRIREEALKRLRAVEESNGK